MESNILNLTDSQVDEYQKRRFEIMQSDEAGYEQATGIAKQLGLYGLWRGVDFAIVTIYNAIHNNND